MRGVRCGTLYKLLGSTYTNGCNNFVVLEKTNKQDKTDTILEKKTMLWHQRLGHIGEKGLRTLHGKGKVWLKVCIIALWILISMKIAYMVNTIE